MFRAVLIVITFFLSGCALAPQTETRLESGTKVTQVFVSKTQRTLYLLDGQKVVKTYPIELGFAPDGHKQAQGDGRTPEGLYWINRRNPNSQYHLSLGISYPNATDRARARAAGVDPGGDIFIHGQGDTDLGWFRRDWTAGCIAVKDTHMEEIFSVVKNGTPIFIKP